MAQTPKELNPFESAHAFFGAELRHWRTLRGLSQAALGRITHDSAALIGRFEKAERWPNRAAVVRLDAALDTGEALVRIWDRASREGEVRRQATPANSEVDTELGLEWHPDLSATTSTIASLWNLEGDLEPVPLRWLATVADGTLLRWHLPEPARPVTSAAIQSDSARRRITMLDVDAVMAMGDAFANADHQLGGGYARSTLGHYLRTVVRPLLSAVCEDDVHRRMLITTARLCDLAGFMSFDSGHQGLAQRYFVQALRLARAIGDDALGAHILGDMTMQALHMDARAQATALGEAAIDAAKRSGSHAVAARATAVASRAFARAGDAMAADQAMTSAERLLEAGASDRDPSWIRFFNAEQLATEFLYACRDLGRTSCVEQIATPLLTASATTMQRRQVLVTASVAAAFLPVDGGGHAAANRQTADPMHALETLRSVLPVLAGVSSARGLAAINDVRARLAGLLQAEMMQQFEADLHDTMLTA